MNNPAAHHRIHYFDFLRVVLAYMGIILHDTVYDLYNQNNEFFREFIPSSNPHHPSVHVFLVMFVTIVHNFRMPLFFVIAGFFSYYLYQARGFLKFLDNRFCRIALPLLIFIMCYNIRLIILYILLILKNHGVIDLTNHYDTLVTFIMTHTHGSDFYCWFLYFLVMYYALFFITMACIPVIRRGFSYIKQDHLFVEIKLPLVSIWLPLIMGFVGLYIMHGLHDWSVTTPSGLIPDPHFIIYYCTFFIFGCLWSAGIFSISQFQQYAKSNAAIGLTILVILTLQPTGMLPFHLHISKLLYNYLYHLCTWLCIFSCIGIFSRYCNYNNKVIRYLSASSYWVYLAHIPITLLISSMITSYISSFYFLQIMTILLVTLCTIITYHFCVRNTWLGNMLNGRRSGQTPLIDAINIK